MAVIVHTRELGLTIVASLVAGVGITAVLSLGIWGAARFVDLSGEERPLAATAAVALTVLSVVVTVAAVTIGVVIMTSK